LKYFFAWLAFFACLTILVPLGINISVSPKKAADSKENSTNQIEVYFSEKDSIVTMNTEEYIQGVLMAEMPADFELEALKAQAVAARTYMAERMTHHSENTHPAGADVCTDFAHCQAYISVEEAKTKWGKNASLYLKKCKKAVAETEGIIAVFNNEPIKAVFHSVSGGMTENASDVWGEAVSYLVSTQSPGEEDAPKYQSCVEVGMEKFRTLARDNWDADTTDNIISNIVRSDAGGVITAQIGDKTVKGTEIRQVFGLNSTIFEVTTNENNVIFDVTGYGHRVGMSQYGANYYAKKGFSYKQILCKYYSGIDFADMNKKAT